MIVMKKNLHLLVIDPQNDFCDLPQTYLGYDSQKKEKLFPALAVPGAHADMQRVAQLIRLGGVGLSAITVTLDSHHHYDIAHPCFWVKKDQQPVFPFTVISAAAVRQEEYLPRDRHALPRVLTYLDMLEKNGRYQLMVWPVHCEIGSWGHNIHPDVRQAYNVWEEEHCKIVQKIYKGSNPWTEHYSAMMAEVPDESDPHTQINRRLIQTVNEADKVYIAGEASSHCVKATTEHLIEYVDPASLSKLVLLTDCMSPVSGFEAMHKQFVQNALARGLQIANAADVLPELIANGESEYAG